MIYFTGFAYEYENKIQEQDHKNDESEYILHFFKINKFEFKFSVSAIIQNNVNIIVLKKIKHQKTKSSFSIKDNISHGIQFSFLILITNFFKFMTFSILNFKDNLDIINYINFEDKPINNNLNRLITFFHSFDCSKNFELFSFESEIKSNFQIKQFLMNLFKIKKQFEPHQSKNIFLIWDNYKRNINQNLKLERICTNKISYFEIGLLVSIVVMFILKLFSVFEYFLDFKQIDNTKLICLRKYIISKYK